MYQRIKQAGKTACKYALYATLAAAPLLYTGCPTREKNVDEVCQEAEEFAVESKAQLRECDALIDELDDEINRINQESAWYEQENKRLTDMLDNE